MSLKLVQTLGTSNELKEKNTVNGNKSRSLKELFKISKFVYYENFLEGAEFTVGHEKIINEYKAGNFAKSNQALLKIISALMLSLLFIPSLAAIGQIRDLIPIVNADNFSIFLFSISAMTSVTLISQNLYLFTFGLTGIIGFFGAKSFKMLEILPFSDDEIEKITFFAFFRTIDVQLIVLFLGLPIITLVMTEGSIVATLAALLISGFHLLFAISIVCLIGSFLAKKIFNPGFASKGKNAIKFIVSVTYVLVTVSMSLIFSLIRIMIEGLFLQSIITGETGSIINAVLSFTVYPFGINYLFSISLFPADKLELVLNQIWIPILGFFFSILVIWFVFKKSLKKLRNATKEEEIGGTESSMNEKSKPIEILPPVKAIMKKDIKFVTRNFNATLYVLMPLFFPLVMAFTLSDIEESSNGTRFLLGLIALLYIGMGLMWTLMASTDSENNTGNLMQTLPFENSDVYKAKRKFILTVNLLGNIIPTLMMLINIPTEWNITILKFLSLILLTFSGTDLILILYGRWFGKTKNGYTILEINPEKKFEKAIVMMVLVYLLLYTPIIITFLVSRAIYSINFGLAFDLYWVELLIAGIIFISIRIIARKMFNQKKEVEII